MNNKELAYKKYGDIINMPRHISMKHKHMSIYDRAAQFAPFAALTGYDAAIDETARLTDRQFELDSDELESLETKLRNLQYIISSRPLVSVTYFEADSRKAGGKYITITGRLDRIDTYLGSLMLSEVPDRYTSTTQIEGVLEGVAHENKGKVAVAIHALLDISQIEE